MLHPLYSETVKLALPEHSVDADIAEVAEIAVHIVDRCILLKCTVESVEPHIHVVGNIAPALEP